MSRPPKTIIYPAIHHPVPLMGYWIIFLLCCIHCSSSSIAHNICVCVCVDRLYTGPIHIEMHDDAVKRLSIPAVLAMIFASYRILFRQKGS
jgi:hypothetical protein